MSRSITRLDAFTDPNLCGHFFAPLDTWTAHLVIIKALDGLALNRHERRLFRKLTGRRYRRTLADALLMILLLWGRRSGKSCLTAFLGLYEAYFVDHSAYLKPGETGMVQVVATDKRQAGIILKYLDAMLADSPILKAAVVRRTADTLQLDNGISIAVSSCSIRAVRGYTCVCVVAEEACFWRDDSGANPDRDVINALLATMATVPSGKCFIISSPWGQSGLVYELHREHFGRDSSRTLVFQAATEVMNPTVSQEFLEDERKRDPISFATEYMALFRAGRSSAFSQAAIDSCLILPDRPLPRSEHLNWHYFAHFDASGGMADAAALAIGHITPSSDVTQVIFLKSWPAPHSPEDVVAETVQYLREYGCKTVVGDAYGAQWVADAFARHGVSYKRCELPRSRLYIELIPLMETAKVEAPNRPSLRQQLTGLERKPRAGGHDVVDHPVGQHDDEANVLAGCVYHTRQSLVHDFDILHVAEPSPFGEPTADVALELIDVRNPSLWGY